MMASQGVRFRLRDRAPGHHHDDRKSDRMTMVGPGGNFFDSTPGDTRTDDERLAPVFDKDEACKKTSLAGQTENSLPRRDGT